MRCLFVLVPKSMRLFLLMACFFVGSCNNDEITSGEAKSVNVISALDKEIKYLTNGAEKQWVWKRSEKCHFGVGPTTNYNPEWFCAQASSNYPCMYDDVLVFNKDFTFELKTGNKEEVFMNWAEVTKFFPTASPQQSVDECRATKEIKKTTSFDLYKKDEKIYLKVPNSTLSYWAGAPEYEVLELTDKLLSVRGIQTTTNGQKLAWYYRFEPGSKTSNPVEECGKKEPLPSSSCTSGGATADDASGNNDVLVWADEFNVDGAPCSKNWTYDIGVGSNGWGNNESQYYTYRSKNVVVENGVLKIHAMKEDYCGSNYTSARLKSQGIFDFKYGKVVVRAKLPSGGGTWPAIWMLGSNISDVGWPACGEIDIMEHVGNRQNTVFSTLHYPNNSGGKGVGKSTLVKNVSSEFHIYELRWTASSLRFFVDRKEYNNISNSSSIPFNHNFFMILNVAMGGGFGGKIDPNFTKSTMEIDYIRVYR